MEQTTQLSDVFIFANPIAGRGRGRLVAERLQRAIGGAGYKTRTFFDRADTIARDDFHVEPSPSAAIVIGGDGTLRAVARRIIQENPPGDRIPLLIVPMGTANLMGQHLGIKWDHRNLERQVLDTLAERKIARLDAATANGVLFLLMAGIGIDGYIVHELDRIRNGPISHLSYVMPTLGAIRRYDFPPITVMVDGQAVCRDTRGIAFVGNIREYGTGFPILPHARSDDELLDVCVLPCKNKREVMCLALAAATRRHTTGKGAFYVKGRRVRIESPVEVPIQVDGEAAGYTPVDIDLLPVRVPFIVPERGTGF
jgi:diacylglycerol kinase family enzyme